MSVSDALYKSLEANESASGKEIARLTQHAAELQAQVDNGEKQLSQARQETEAVQEKLKAAVAEKESLVGAHEAEKKARQAALAEFRTAVEKLTLIEAEQKFLNLQITYLGDAFVETATEKANLKIPDQNSIDSDVASSKAQLETAESAIVA